MKLITIIFVSLISFSVFAQNNIKLETNFVSPTQASANISWTDVSFQDWASAVLRARVNVVANAEGIIKGVAYFSYVPENGLMAVALKQSSGKITLEGAVDDFTDEEGRRIISLKPGQPITIKFDISKEYKNVGKNQPFDIMVELSPIEYVVH